MVYPRTHRFGELLDLAEDHGLALPPEFDTLHELTPFAVEYRCEFYSEEVENPLNQPAVPAEVPQLRGWIEVLLAAKPGQSSG